MFTVRRINSLVSTLPQSARSSFLDTPVIINQERTKTSHNILVEKSWDGSTLKHQIGQTCTSTLSL